jgi:hypothetical protein
MTYHISGVGYPSIPRERYRTETLRLGHRSHQPLRSQIHHKKPARPFDYLLSSSDVTMAKVSAKQPATSILYQLYLDSGAKRLQFRESAIEQRHYDSVIAATSLFGLKYTIKS